MGVLHWLLRHLAGRAGQPRVVRRVRMTCPRRHETVEIDLLLGPTGMPDRVLRCSARREIPPSCDQACRLSPEAVRNAAEALLLLPHGSGPPVELD